MSRWKEWAKANPEKAAAHAARPRAPLTREQKDRANARARARYAANPQSKRQYNRERARRPDQKEQRRQYHVRRTYGANLVALLERQLGCCALCTRRLRKGKFAHVDHDHDTGVVRGLLCSRCNSGLGFFGDDPRALRRAAAYLEGGVIMSRFSLTITDLEGYEVRAVADLLDSLDDPRQPGTQDESGDTAAPSEDAPETSGAGKRGRKVKAPKPATLPANTASPAPAPIAPAPEPTQAAAPTPVEVPVPVAPAVAPTPTAPPAPAAPAGNSPTMDSLIAKARLLGTGPLGQTGLLCVLNAMAVPSLPKVPEAQYPALDALLDAAIAYSGTPAPTKDWFKTVCATGQYDAATRALIEATNAAMGL